MNRLNHDDNYMKTKIEHNDAPNQFFTSLVTRDRDEQTVYVKHQKSESLNLFFSLTSIEKKLAN